MAKGELGTRMIFGPAMLAAVALIYWLDVNHTRGWLTAGVLGLLAIAGVGEYVAMMRHADHRVAGGMLLTFTALLAASAFLFHGWQQVDRELYPLAMGTLMLLFPIAVRTLSPERMRRGLEEQGATLLGFVWIAWPLYLAQGMAVRNISSVLLVIVICKGGDIGAYFSGIAFGRHKLIPHVSGGKTIEGTIGGIVVAAAISAVLAPRLMPAAADVGLTLAVAIGIILDITAQIGDLVESALKRSCGVKDSSRLLPAHGGVLDLVDSLLFSFPVYFLLLVAIT